MVNDCWLPDDPLQSQWNRADECGPTNRWVPSVGSTSVVCEAIACLAVACVPEPPTKWARAEDSGNKCVVGNNAATTTGFDKGFK